MLKQKAKSIKERERDRERGDGRESPDSHYAYPDETKKVRCTSEKIILTTSKGLQVIKPKEQLNLTDEQLNEEIHIVLTANDPQLSDSLVIYSLMDEGYKASPNVDQFASVFDLEGYCFTTVIYYYKLSITQDIACMLRLRKVKSKLISIKKKSASKLCVAPRSAVLLNFIHTFCCIFISLLMFKRYGGGEFDDDSGPTLRNPFNFSDRAVQTNSRPPRVIFLLLFVLVRLIKR